MTRYTRGFLPRILAIFSSLWVFSPSTCPFSSHSPVYSAPRKHWCAQQTRIYLRTNRSQICALQTNMCMWVHSRSLNKKDWIIPSAINLLHDRNGRVNFLHGLVFIHCVHSSGGCWHSLESVDCLMIDTVNVTFQMPTETWPTSYCTTQGYNRFSSCIVLFLGWRWGWKYCENSGSRKPVNTPTDLIKEVGVRGNYSCILHLHLPNQRIAGGFSWKLRSGPTSVWNIFTSANYSSVIATTIRRYCILKPGFHIVVSVVSVVSVVRKKFIGQIEFILSRTRSCICRFFCIEDLYGRFPESYICPKNFFHTTDTTDTTIWKPGLRGTHDEAWR